ncbi:MAG: response regulator [Gemmatimonadaceae bacterium]
MTASRIRVLVADDDAAARALIVSVLGELDYETQTASDGDEAWRRFAEWQPEMVILAVDLPATNGIDLCRRIRDADGTREAFVVFLTAHDHPETLEMTVDAGGDEFIVKPTTPAIVRARLIVARRRIAQDAARRSAEEELSKARWLSGIGEATLALQHEINNPLSALLGNAELMQMELAARGEKSELLTIIHEQALRIAEVVRRLRQLKNPESVDYVGGSRMIDLWGNIKT